MPVEKNVMFAAAIAAVLLFIIIAAAPAFCEDGSPRLVLPKTVIDLGFSFQGEKTKLMGEFIIRNDGTAPLNIKEIRPSCGCTVVEPESKVVHPGSETTVTVSVDTSDKLGKLKKSVFIKTDDPGMPDAKVDVLIEVRMKDHTTMNPGQTLFKGNCAECHAKPAEGKSGEPLFEAACAMCHGHYGLGGLNAPGINDLGWLDKNDSSYIKKAITKGKPGTSMPGFGAPHGGPLDDSQIDSLVELIQWWKEGFVFKTNEERHGRINRH
ncbi:MAG: DUF1573 domain-containing protein [Deltaproteobacteria bacterium]|nr:DUF1573 domain-containing protein [Deltaproteobacteria bacterium]